MYCTSSHCGKERATFPQLMCCTSSHCGKGDPPFHNYVLYMYIHLGQGETHVLLQQGRFGKGYMTLTEASFALQSTYHFQLYPCERIHLYSRCCFGSCSYGMWNSNTSTYNTSRLVIGVSKSMALEDFQSRSNCENI